MPSELYALAAYRTAWNPKHADLYLAEPNLFCQHTTIRMNGTGGITVRRTLDIVDNNVEVRADSAATAFAARMEQGVVDTQAEAVLLSDPDHSRSAAVFSGVPPKKTVSEDIYLGTTIDQMIAQKYGQDIDAECQFLGRQKWKAKHPEE